MQQFTEEEMMKDLEAADASGDYELAQAIANKIKELRSTQYQPENPNLMDSAGNFLSNIMDVPAAAMGRASEVYNKPELAGVPEPMRLPTAAAGGLAAGAYKYAEGAAEFIGDVASTLTPDFLEKPIVDKAVEFGNYIKNTDLAREAVEKLQEGYVEYNQWKSRSKNNAAIGANLEALGEFYSVGVARNVREVASFGIGRPVKKIGEGIQKSGYERGYSNRAEATKEMLKPDDWQRTGDYEVKGKIFDTITWKPSEFEEEVMRYVNSIDKFDPNRIEAYNAKVIQEHLTNLNLGLKEKLQKRSVGPKAPRADVSKLRQDIFDAVEEYMDSAEFTARGLPRGRSQAFLEIADEILAGVDGTPISLLNARQAIDNRFKKMLQTDDLARRAEGSELKNDVMAIVRNGVNSQLFEMMPDGDAIKETLRKQYLLFRAHDIIDAKGRKNKETALGRVLYNFKDTTGIELPKTPLGLGVTAGVGATFLTDLPIETIIMTSGLAGAAYLGRSIWKNPRGRVTIGALVKKLGDAIENKSGKLSDPIILNQYVELRDQLIAGLEEENYVEAR